MNLRPRQQESISGTHRAHRDNVPGRRAAGGPHPRFGPGRTPERETEWRSCAGFGLAHTGRLPTPEL